MARNEMVDCPSGTWTLLTNADVTALRAQNIAGADCYIQATVGTTPPTSREGSAMLHQGTTLAADLSLADLFPGVAGANRVWGQGVGASAVLSVSHA